MTSLHSLPSWNERVPSTPGPVDRLPQPITSFIGREAETDALLDLVTDPRRRLVTVTGPGGIGKTRLALQVARRCHDVFRDGVVFVGLADVRDSNLVPGTLAHALDVRDAPGQPLIERIRERYHDTDLLLVLDNLEHLLDAAPFVTSMLTRCAGIAILATSRSRLHVSGEHIFEVRPLSNDSAVKLFAERALAIAPDFSMTDASRPAIAEICAHLDGLPLAIELAAARTPVLPPTAIHERLGNLMDLLSDGPRDAPDRHRGMRQTIAWSHDLLDEDAQALFRALAVFEGGFTLEAVSAIAGEAIDPLACLSTLEASSLVRLRPDASGTPRFRMLETVREFALEQLRRHGEETTARDAHADHVTDLAADTEWVWWLSGGLDKLDRLEPEIPNIRAALAWMHQQVDAERVIRLAASLAPMWATRGYSMDGRATLEWALPRSDAVPPETLVVALRALSWILNQHDEYYRSLVIAQDALRLSNEIDDGRNRAASYILSGIAGKRLGHFNEAATWFTDALREVDGCPGESWAPVTRCIVLNQLAAIEFEMGRIDPAEAWLTQLLAMQQELDLRFTPASHVYRQFGEIARARGNLRVAMTQFRAALDYALEVRDVRAIGIGLGGLAGTLAELGQYDLAARLFGAAEVHHERIDCPFADSTFAIQRALGLPEPWSSMHPECTVADGLRRAQWERTAQIRAITLDAEQAQVWWNEGRALTIDEAMAQIPPVESIQTAPAMIESGLSPREVDVLRLIAQGLSDREIAATLFISPRTVQNHVQGIYRKIEVSSRSAATRWAMEHGLD